MHIKNEIPNPLLHSLSFKQGLETAPLLHVEVRVLQTSWPAALVSKQSFEDPQGLPTSPLLHV